jgi:hypothetical protein
MTLLLGEPSPGFLVAVMTPHAKGSSTKSASKARRSSPMRQPFSLCRGRRYQIPLIAKLPLTSATERCEPLRVARCHCQVASVSSSLGPPPTQLQRPSPLSKPPRLQRLESRRHNRGAAPQSQPRRNHVAKGALRRHARRPCRPSRRSNHPTSVVLRVRSASNRSTERASRIQRHTWLARRRHPRYTTENQRRPLDHGGFHVTGDRRLYSRFS